MSRIVSPSQTRYNDPYQQRIFQFSSQDSRVYLSRISNYILKSVGNNTIIKDITILDKNLIDNVVTVQVSSGLLIQDSTLIELLDTSTLTLDVSGYDHCEGKLILYTNYQYLESIESNNFRLKLSFITNDGLIISPIDDPWDENKNNLYIEIFNFNRNLNTIEEILHPDHTYINGKRYYRRGLDGINFLTSNNTQESASYYNLAHNYLTYNIFSQLFDSDLNQQKINNLTLTDIDNIRLNIDEYTISSPDYYKLLVHHPDDVESFTILKSALVSNIGTITHSLNQQYVMVQVYNDSHELIHPRLITYTDADTLTIDFSNLEEDLAASYTILITKDNTNLFTLNEVDFQFEYVTINHNLNTRNVTVQVIDSANNLVLYNNSILQISDLNNIIINTQACGLAVGDYTIIIYDNINLVFNLYNDYSYSIPYHIFVRRFEQTDLLSDSLTVVHNLNQSYPIVQLFDASNNIYQADIVESTDADTIVLTFNDPSLITGVNKVVIYNYENNQIFSLDSSYMDPVTYIYQVDLSATDLISPFFQVYNDSDIQVVPTQITESSANVYDFDFSSDPTIGDINIVCAEGFNTYTQIFDETDPVANEITITHDLNTLFPLVQLWDNDSVIYPTNITIIDGNSLLLDLSAVNLTLSHDFNITIITGLPRQALIISNTNYYITEFGEDDLTAGLITISHNLAFSYPIVQVYNHLNKKIDPDSITILNQNQIQLDFSTFTYVDDFYKVSILRG
jgi:hypothetical protein